MSKQITSIYTTQEFDASFCKFSKPVKDETNYHKSSVIYTYDSSKGFILQTPKITIRNFNDTEDDSIDSLIRGQYQSRSNVIDILINRNKEKHRNLYHIIRHLEDLAINQISDNSIEWFGTKMSRYQISTMFKSCIHCPIDIDNPFVLTINKASDITLEENNQYIFLIKVDGIIFGRNSSRLDMKIIQCKQVKSEDKIQTDIVDYDQLESSNDYSDLASQAPFRREKNSNDQVKFEKVVDSLPTSNDIVSEPVIESVSESTNEFVDQSVDNVDVVNISSEDFTKEDLTKEVDSAVDNACNKECDQECNQVCNQTYNKECDQVSDQVSIERLKIQLMKSIVENDYARVAEILDILKRND
jgi:hypothetical protein